VVAGTTTEESLRNSLKDAGIGAEVVAAKTHRDGLTMLDDGKFRPIRRPIDPPVSNQGQQSTRKAAARRRLFEHRALRAGAASRRQRLSPRRRPRPQPHLSLGEIGTIFELTFGGKVKPSQILQTLYLISGLPD